MYPNIVYRFCFFLLCWQVRYLHCQETERASLVIKKCSCEGNEILSISGCLNETRPTINIWNKENGEATVVNLTTSNSVIQPLECPHNTEENTLYDTFPIISTEGKLMIHSSPETDLYCLEYILNDVKQIYPQIKRCINRLSLRLCCQADEYLDASERCTKNPSDTQKKLVLQWLQGFKYETKRSVCKEGDIVHEEIKIGNFGDLKSYLRYVEQRTQSSFCLGVYGDENEMYFSANYCNSSLMHEPKPPKVPHCCDRNEAFDLERLRCLPHERSFDFPIDVIEWPSQGIREALSFPNCSALSVLSLKDTGKHFFATNGSLISEKGHSIPFSGYCLGAVIADNLTLHSGMTCLIDEEPIPCSWRWDISVACLSISSLFLIATLVVYLGIPELRRRIGGVCLISELFALLVSQITLIVLQTNRRNFSPSGCLAAGVIEIIFFLASFFWLNIMCYDVWSTFRVFRPYSEKILRKKLFIKYSLYGWGLPLIMGIAVVVVEHLDVKLKPHFSPDTRCFFSDQDLALQWLYLYGWILLLLLVNLCLFTHLAFTLFSNHWEQKKNFHRAGGSKTSSKNEGSQDMENLKLHGKLFIIMGVPWLIEVFTSFASKETLCYIWFLDLLNMLRGMLIFIIFVCKKSARDMIIANWFPSYKEEKSSSSSDRSRKTSTMSLSGWLSSFHGRKISKVSTSSLGMHLETLKEEKRDQIIKEEGEEREHEGNENQVEEGQIQETKT